MKDVIDEAKTVKVMKMIRSIWDNGAKSKDRYTIITKEQSNPPSYDALGVSDDISFSQWSDALEGKHLGKKIKFSNLPTNVQNEVISRLSE